MNSSRHIERQASLRCLCLDAYHTVACVIRMASERLQQFQNMDAYRNIKVCSFVTIPRNNQTNIGLHKIGNRKKQLPKKTIYGISEPPG